MNEYNFDVRYKLTTNISVGQVLKIKGKSYVVNSYKVELDGIRNAISNNYKAFRLCTIYLTDNTKLSYYCRRTSSPGIYQIISHMTDEELLARDRPKDLIKFTRELL